MITTYTCETCRSEYDNLEDAADCESTCRKTKEKQKVIKDLPVPTPRAYEKTMLSVAMDFCPELYACKRCHDPYPSGYVCRCGWDNTHDFPPKPGSAAHALALELQELDEKRKK